MDLKPPQGLKGESLARFTGVPLPTQPGGRKANQRLSHESGGVSRSGWPQPVPDSPQPPRHHARAPVETRRDHGAPNSPQGLVGESLIRFLGWPLPQRRRERPLSESRKSLAGHLG
jgi:hypothetical protein